MAKATRPFSIGYAYAQTEHYRQAVAAQRVADPFEGIEIVDEAPAAPIIPQQQERGTVPSLPTATEAQVRYAMSLHGKKTSGSVDPETAEAGFRAMTRQEISRAIDTMKAMPDAAKKSDTPQVTEGMYRDPGTGTIYKVQVAHHGSGNLYAKQLVKLDEVRVKRNKEYSHDFEYAPGVIRAIKPEWKMTRDEAAEWGRLYGACCKCGTILTDEKSIAAGIGPVCAESF